MSGANAALPHGTGVAVEAEVCKQTKVSATTTMVVDNADVDE